MMSQEFQNAFVKNFLKIITVLLVIGLFLYLIVSFIISITLGGIIAMALIPVLAYFEQKRGLSRSIVLILMCLVMILIALVPLALFVIHSAKVITGVVKNSDFNTISKNA